MTPPNERAAALMLAEHAFAPATPGFVGAAVDVPMARPLEEGTRLRHGFLAPRSPGPGLGTVSGPPSPGLEVCIDRMADDLAAAGPVLDGVGDYGVRVALEAGLEGGGPLGLTRRWALAHTLAPVLAAAFANSPTLDGWRSGRQARHRHLPVLRAVADPRRSWAAYVLEQPGPFRGARHDHERPGLDDLARHVEALTPPVAARGHLEIDVADRPPRDGWKVVVAVTAVLLDDPRAAAATEEITAPLAAEAGLWERAARDGLSDPALAVAARECFLQAYGTLARHGTGRDLRDQVAEFTEQYVMRGRCPADDVLERTVRPARR
ncbi:glutamate-cysteine ligase family protein [Paractinoplanes ovalisporus]|uniref:glutamate-cysteine ligase family protein n=1 Tax=Paractinoplanes ovalisporus TaxID=2810368 RepID=UPI0027DD7080|nr:glutamate-cysteine ligase family protein [Actinoplanes ovalisporus]